MSVTPFGIKIIKSFRSSDFNASVVEVEVAASDSTALFLNDIVAVTGTTENNIEIVTKASSASFIRGVVVGFIADHDRENDVYRVASTKRFVRISEDPFLICQARVDDVVASTDINRFINIDSGTGNTSTGISAVALDYTSINDIEGQFKITRIVEIQSDYSIVECIIQKHEYLHDVVAAENLWDRNAGTSTLEPHFPNDNVDIGTGNFSGEDGNFNGNVQIDGKLTVDGSIDPTDLQLTPQASAPATADGTVYYDSGTDRFLFRENGAWIDIGDTSIWERTGSTVSLETAGDTLDLSNSAVTIESVASLLSVVAATGIATVADRIIPVESSTAGDSTVTANPAIVAGTNGQRLTIIGTDDTKTVTFDDGNGLALDNGQSITLGENDVLELVFYNSLWIETTRKDN